MANYEATKYDYSGANLSGIEGTATGTILPWTTSSAPSGFLECNGAAVSRSTYSALFGVIGTTYGAGDGSTTFLVPNLADNTPIGKSPGKALASTGGANAVTQTGNIAGSTANATLSTAQLASHSHAGGRGNQGRTSIYAPQDGNFGPGSLASNTGNAGSGGGHSHNMSASFSGASNSVVQPYLTVLYIIKT
tara:strand:- start:677 stop:1252 length:576 start_codon:yes stop_codon:yes gene_type:complete